MQRQESLVSPPAVSAYSTTVGGETLQQLRRQGYERRHRDVPVACSPKTGPANKGDSGSGLRCSSTATSASSNSIAFTAKFIGPSLVSLVLEDFVPLLALLSQHGRDVESRCGAVAEVDDHAPFPPRSSNRTCRFPASGSRTRPIGSQSSRTAVNVGWLASVWHRFRDLQTHNQGVRRLAQVWGFPCCVRSPCIDMPSSIPRWPAGF